MLPTITSSPPLTCGMEAIPTLQGGRKVQEDAGGCVRGASSVPARRKEDQRSPVDDAPD